MVQDKDVDVNEHIRVDYLSNTQTKSRNIKLSHRQARKQAVNLVDVSSNSVNISPLLDKHASR